MFKVFVLRFAFEFKYSIVYFAGCQWCSLPKTGEEIHSIHHSPFVHDTFGAAEHVTFLSMRITYFKRMPWGEKGVVKREDSISSCQVSKYDRFGVFPMTHRRHLFLILLKSIVIRNKSANYTLYLFSFIVFQNSPQLFTQITFT